MNANYEREISEPLLLDLYDIFESARLRTANKEKLLCPSGYRDSRILSYLDLQHYKTYFYTLQRKKKHIDKISFPLRSLLTIHSAKISKYSSINQEEYNKNY